jgi:hypothetical protein
MKRARPSRLFSILLCAGAAGMLLGCGEAAGDAEPDPAPDGGEGDDGGDGPGAAMVPELEAPVGGCLVRTPGAGLASMPLTPLATVGVVDLEATSTTLAADGVIGLSRGAPSGVGRLAAAVRFAPDGALQARDGQTFRADHALAFQPGRTYAVRAVADLPSRTYSVYVHDPGTGDVVRIARDYALRLPGGGPASLDALSAIATGDAGQLSVCNVLGVAGMDVVYSRAGSYAVAPLPGDQAIVSDGVATTWRLGPAGQVLRRVARGGEVAADPAGNVYVALAAGGQLALHALTPQLASRWSRVEQVAPFADVTAISADPAGVTVALATPFGVASIRRFPADGGPGTWLHSGGALAALAPDGFAVATAWEGGFAVLLYDLTGGLRWARSFEAPATIEVLTLGLGGRLVVGGHFSGPITFGGPTLEPAYDGQVDVNSYVLGLSREGGEHVFTTRIPTTVLTGAAGNAGRLVIAGETWVTPVFPHLWQLDAGGNLLPGEPETGFYEQWGRSGRVAIGASNRIYWERSMVWPRPTSLPFPYLLAIDP